MKKKTKRITCPHCLRSYSTFYREGRLTIRKHYTCNEILYGVLNIYPKPKVCHGSHMQTDGTYFYSPVREEGWRDE